MNASRNWLSAASDTAEVELQADVMRFVAILALCLVAISSLVDQTVTADPEDLVATPVEAVTAPVRNDELQIPAEQNEPDTRPISESVPVTTPASSTPPPPSSTRVADAGVVTLPVSRVTTPRPTVRTSRSEAAKPKPEVTSSMPLPTVKPTPAPKPVPTPEPRPDPVPAAAPETTPETPQTATSTPDRRGFTLRFGSDAAMLRLASRGEAGVFLIDGGQAWQLGFGDAGAQFVQAPAPAQFHAIAADTVPRLLREAATRDTPGADAVWGVTLPERTVRELADLLRAHDHGDLIIDSRGRITLEQGDDA